MGTPWRDDAILFFQPRLESATAPGDRLGRRPHFVCARCRGPMPAGDVAPLCPGCRAPRPTLRYGKPPGGPGLRGPRRPSVVFCARCGRPLLGPPGSTCPETCQLTPRSRRGSPLSALCPRLALPGLPGTGALPMTAEGALQRTRRQQLEELREGGRRGIPVLVWTEVLPAHLALPGGRFNPGGKSTLRVLRRPRAP